MHNFKKLTFAILAMHFLLMFQSVSQSDVITQPVTYYHSFQLIDEEDIIDWKGDVPGRNLLGEDAPVRVSFEVYIDPGRIDTEIHGRVIFDRETKTPRVEPRWTRNDVCDQFVGKFATRGGIRIGGNLVIAISIGQPFLSPESGLGLNHDVPLSAIINPLLPVDIVPENIDRSWDEAAYFNSSLDGTGEPIILQPKFRDLVQFELGASDILEGVLAFFTAGASRAVDTGLTVAANVFSDDEDERKKQKGALRTVIEKVLGNSGFNLNGGLRADLGLSNVKVGIDEGSSTIKGDKMVVHTRCDGTLSAKLFLTLSADFFVKFAPLGVEVWTTEAEIATQDIPLTDGHKVATLNMKGTPNPVEFPLNINAQDFTQWHLPGGASARLGKGITEDMAYSPNGDLIAVGTSTGAWLYDAHTGAEVALLSAGFVGSVSFSSDGKTLATSGSGYGADLVRFWDVSTRTEKPWQGSAPSGRIVGFGRNGTILVTKESGDDDVNLWEVAAQTRKIRKVWNVRTVSLSPDGEILAIIYSRGRGTIELMDVDTGEPIATITGYTGPIFSLSFSPDSRTLAAGNDYDTVYLWDVAAQTVKATLKGPTDTVDLTSISFSPDGSTLASGGADGTVRVWELATGEQIASLTGYIGWYNRVSFGRDGKTLASLGLEDGTVIMWDVDTAIPKFSISGYDTILGQLHVIFSPDGKTLASTGSSDGAIHLWDVASGRQRAVLNGCRGVGEYITSASFSPDGKTLASAGTDAIVRLWDVASGREITSLKHDWGVSHVNFSPDGKTLASNVGDAVRLWNVGDWTERAVLRHSSSVDSVSFSPDNRTLATTVGSDRDVYLWNLDTGVQIGALAGHTKRVESVSFSPYDGVFLASAGRDGLFLWDVAARKKIATLTTEHVMSVTFSPDRDSKMLASSGYEGTVRLWNVEARTQIAVLNKDGDVYNLSFSPNGKKLAGLGGHGRNILLWDVDTGTEIAMISGAVDTFSSVSFSPDSRTLASAGYDPATVHLWDIATGKEKIMVTRRHTGGAASSYTRESVTFSPDKDSKMLASGGYDGTVRLWDVETRTEILELSGDAGLVRSVRFSPDKDSKMLASGEWDGTVRLWNAVTGKEIGALTGHTRSVFSVVFSPDGKRLASVDGDPYEGELRLWDVENQREIATLTGNNWDARSVSFSPVRDSKLLAGAGDDGMVRLWDVDTGTEIAVIPGPADVVTSVSFSPDGKTLAAAGYDEKGGVVYLWEVATRTEIAVIRVQGTNTPSVSFSPDSRTLAYADPGSYTVRLWDIGARLEKPGLTMFASDVNGVSFSPDGKTLAIADSRRVRLWDVATRIPKVTIRLDHVNKAIFSPDGRTLVISRDKRLFWLRVPTSGAVADATRLAADINGDGVVNVQDLVAVSAALGQTGNNAADVNGDGAVNIQDLVAVAAALAEAAAAPALNHATTYVEGLTAAEVETLDCPGAGRKPRGSGIATRHPVPSLSVRDPDAQRNGAPRQLSKPVQPGNLDALPPGETGRGGVDHLRRRWRCGARLGVGASACRRLSSQEPRRLLGWQKFARRACREWRLFLYAQRGRLHRHAQDAHPQVGGLPIPTTTPRKYYRRQGILPRFPLPEPVGWAGHLVFQ